MLTLKFKDVSAAGKYGVSVDDMLKGFTKSIGNAGTVSYNNKKDIIFVQLGKPCTNPNNNITLPVELTTEDGKNIAKIGKK